jgi:hypothetical protein
MMINLPPRTEQLCGPRREDEGVFDYVRRAWEAEFEDALGKITDVNVRNALFALKNLYGRR